MRVLAIGDPLWGDASHLMLYQSAHGHEVRTAGPGGAVDYVFEPHETTAEFLARIASEWQPDVLYCGFPEMYPPPLAVEECPILTVAAISDWNLYAPQMEYNLCRFDVVLSDLAATRQLKVHGIQPQYLFPQYSHRTHIHRLIDAEQPRDIDVLFLGNLNHAIHRGRGEVLEHLAKHSEGLRVVIDAGLPPDLYARRLNEAKIALNFGVRGEMNLRAFEAPACGALLFMEDENLETFDWLEPGTHCIPYTLDNLMERVRYFVEHEEARERIAMAGHRRVLDLSAEKRLDMLFNWMARTPRGTHAFHDLDARRKALADAMFYGASMDAGQRAYSKECLASLRGQLPNDGEVLLAFGCSAYDHASALGNGLAQREERRELIREAIEAFDAAQRALPDEVVPLLNMAVLARQAKAAAEENYLRRATEAAQAHLGGYLLGKVIDPYYAEWRLQLGLGRAQVAHLHAMANSRLAEIALERKDYEGALQYALEAQSLALHMGGNHTLAGRAAMAMGDLDQAEEVLREGLRFTSFDATHRQALIEVLRKKGKNEEARDLATESARLFACCPPMAPYVPMFEALAQ